MKKVLFLLLFLLVLGAASISAQVRIGGDEVPNEAAVLDLNVDNDTDGTKGLALPRVSLASTDDKLGYSDLLEGMLVYNTNAGITGGDGVGVYYWDGSQWVKPAGSTTVADGSITASKLAQMGAASGQVLKWNGTAWAPAADNNDNTNTTYTGSTSITLSGTSFERAALTGDVTAAANANATTIANNAVTMVKIADAAVTSAKIADGSIATAKLANNAVTVAKLPTGASSTTFLRGDGTWVTPTDNNTTYTGSTSITLSGTSFQRPALTGDVTAAANANATTIANNAVTTAKIADNAINSAKIADGTIATADIANNAITSAKIADGTIATADLANSSVTRGKTNMVSGYLDYTLPNANGYVNVDYPASCSNTQMWYTNTSGAVVSVTLYSTGIVVYGLGNGVSGRLRYFCF